MRQQWEYKLITHHVMSIHDLEALEVRLNSLGEEGWDVIRVEQRSDELFYTIWLKRPAAS